MYQFSDSNRLSHSMQQIQESIIQSFATMLSFKSEAIIQLPSACKAGCRWRSSEVTWITESPLKKSPQTEAHNSGKNTALQILDMRSP